MTTTTLAHFSDPHLSHEPRLRLRERFSKRQLSAWSWQRARREIQAGGVLQALLADLREHHPDHVAITGDITNFSLHEEFSAAANWLKTLGAPEAVSIVPGNHDALVKVDEAAALGRWQPWMSADRNRPQGAPWPYVRIRGEIALIGLNSARPTLPALASGFIGADQLARLEPILAELGARHLFRIVMVHHPLADGAVSARKALRNRAALRQVLAQAGAELVLHGHARDARFDTIAGPIAPILCLGLPSSSAIPNPKDEGARWHYLTICRLDTGLWRLQVEARLWNLQTNRFERGGAYSVRIERSAARQ